MFEILMPDRSDVLSIGPAFLTVSVAVFVIVAAVILLRVYEASEKPLRAVRERHLGFRGPGVPADPDFAASGHCGEFDGVSVGDDAFLPSLSRYAKPD